MADFTIPKGKDYTFTLKVIESESFLPQDLTNMATANIEILLLSSSCSVFTTSMTVIDAINGELKCTIPSASTNLLTVERGPKEDGYYAKPTHSGIVTVTFTDATPDRLTIIKKIYAAATECIT